MKKIFAIVTIMLGALIITGCSALETTKEYSANGVSVTMDEGFVQKENVAYTTYFLSDNAMFLALKEDFSSLSQIGLSENSSLKDYAEVIKTANNLENEFKEQDNFMYTTYESEVSGKEFFYLAAVYKTDDSFWLVNFACSSSDKDVYTKKFLEWAKTVKFEK